MYFYETIKTQQTMKTVTSDLNDLGLDRMSIYFLSNPSNEHFNEMILRLNQYDLFTCKGLYTYKVMSIDTCSEDYCDLPEEILCELNKSNFVKRLPNDLDGNIIYSFDCTELSEQPAEFYKQMWSFIDCEMYFEYCCLEDLVAQLNRPKSTEQRKRRRDLKDMRFAIESVMRTTTLRDVNKCISSILKPTNTTISIEDIADYKTNQQPNLHISIEKVPYIDKRKHREYTKYGVSVKFGDYSIPISFESTDQTMLYIAAILRYKINRPLYVHELRNNQKGSTLARDISRKWLSKLFSVIISKEQRAFDRWIDGTIRYRGNKGQAIYQAKSASTRRIKQRLQLCPNAILYCILNSEEGDNKDTYYNFKCHPDNISVCEELQEVMNEFETTLID